jgi:two-component system, NarL family, sensor kinase
MKKTIFIFCLFFCALQNVQAQLPELLQKQISKQPNLKEDTNKVNLLIDISWEMANYDSSKTEFYIQEALSISQKIKYNDGIKDAYNCYGNLYEATNNFPKSLVFYNKELVWMQEHNDKAIYKLYQNIGNLYASWEKHDSALMYYDKGFEICKKNNDKKGLAIAYNCYGTFYANKGELDKSIQYLIMGLKEKEALNDTNGVAIGKSNLSVLFKEVGKLEEALNYGKDAQKLYETLGKEVDAARCMVNNGMLYARKKEFAVAEKNYIQAIKILEKSSNTMSLAGAYSNLGLAQRQQNKVPEAKTNFLKALAIGKKSDSKMTIGITSHELGSIELFYKNYNNVLPYLIQADSIASQKSYKELQKDVYQTYSDYYTAIGNNEKALFYFKKFTDLKDTMLNADNMNSIEEMKTKYETEKKEQLLIVKDVKIAKQRTSIYAGIALAALGLLLGLSYFRTNKLRQQKNLQAEILKQQDFATKAVIEAEEKERVRIAADLHDGIGQLLSAAKMNLHALEGEVKLPEAQTILDKAIYLVDQSTKEIRSVSHNILPNALIKSGLGFAVKDFIDKIENKNLHVNVNTTGLNEKLQTNVEIVVYRIIQECVNNVIKHANANKLEISLINENEDLDIIIEDNGKGFDFAKSISKGGIGLENIKTRVQYLKGTIEIDSKENNGTVISIHIPLKTNYEI